MSPYITYSLITVVFFTLSIISFKYTAKHGISNPYAYFFYYFCIYFILGLFIPIFVPIQIIPKDFSVLLYNIPYATFIYIGIFCFSLAIYKLDVSTISPLSNFGIIFSSILAVLFLKENVSTNQIPWMILIIICAFLSSYNEKQKLFSFVNRYIFFYLIFQLCLSFTRIFANIGINKVGYWNFTFYEFCYGFIGILFFLPFIYKHLKVNLKSIIFLIPGVVFEFIGLLAFLKAISYQIIIPSIVTSIPLSSIVVFLISRFDKKMLENHSLKVYLIRFAAIFIMTISVIILNFI